MKMKHTFKTLIAAALAAVVLTGCADRAGEPVFSNVINSSGVSDVSGVSDSESSSSTSSGASTATSSTPVSTAPVSSTPASSSVESTSAAPESSTPESAPVSSTTESKPESTTTSTSESSVPASTPESTSSENTSGGTGTPVGNTPYERHGGLAVKGTDLVDANGAKFQLRGMSTHGLAWFPQFVNYDTFKFLRDDWNTNCVRLAMYTAEYGGYCSGGDQAYLKSLVSSGVEYATQLGMYVIIDWHVLQDQNPLTYKDEAKKFFDEMSRKYANNGNVIYEICNEPNGWASWNDIKTYANEVIPVIRANSPNSVIIVGTPTWSQDIDQALASPLSFNNVMYTLHFYAATHTDWLRSRMETCIRGGLPVFISEFGMCDASGNGAIDEYQSGEWKKLIDKYNISYMCWNLANKNESSSILKESCQKLTDWTDGDLNTQGRLIRGWFMGETD